MTPRQLIISIFTHGFALIIGFAAGIYALPILIAPEGPPAEVIESTASNAIYTGEFRKDLKDSDTFHWGEGTVSIGPKTISLMGELAPGPDYKLYLSPEFVETENDFERIKPQMQQVGDVKTFDNFLVSVPAGIDPSQYNTVIVWCESFGEFITAARYQ
ncbi:DM13 domain-containing protein [Enterovibrio sp. ZSDZ35]|uniref:DM13 domain-containing protein n=1 Tax=Enterovibrio qingdaonensis TaxID=2899818 RepID=A0ABT5QP18_9GAMM|nr:DM13 domain-containing protein [Enterovibrio sp. ZSDZ35]MDD1782724.1 DM13 domain-containing protein [Enterovibrio sp. ZSDZ35]